MPETTYYPYVGSGQVAACVAGASTGLIPIGNLSKIELAVKDKQTKLQDYTKPGGGTYASVNRIESVTLAMTLHDLNKTNVARALFGTGSTVATGSVADEVVTANKGAFVPLAHTGLSAVVVKNSAGDVTYVANTDYEVRSGSIFILDAGAITNAQSLKVSYTYAAYDKVEALTTGAITLELYCEFANEANSGKPVIVHVYRAQLSPAKALSLLDDKFAELQIDAEVLADTSKTGTGISKYFNVKLA